MSYPQDKPSRYHEQAELPWWLEVPVIMVVIVVFFAVLTVVGTALFCR